MVGVRFTNLTLSHTSVETQSCFITRPTSVTAAGCHGQSANFLTSGLVHLRHASGWAFEECSIRHSGGYAVWFEQGATDCRVHGCHIADVGAGGVRVGVSTHVDPEAPKQVSLSGNLIEDGGHVYPEGCGVLARLLPLSGSAVEMIFADDGRCFMSDAALIRESGRAGWKSGQ